MAEFLILAENSWMDALTASQKTALGEKYTRRYERGDVVAVFEDGHKWGREECAPKFAIVKVAGMSIEEARKYIECILGENADPMKRELLKKRKYNFASSDTDGYIENSKTMALTEISKAVFNSKILDKALAAIIEE